MIYHSANLQLISSSLHPRMNLLSSLELHLLRYRLHLLIIPAAGLYSISLTDSSLPTALQEAYPAGSSCGLRKFFPMGLPPFRLDGSRYDLTTYSGRFQHFVNLINPRALFYSREKIRASARLLEDYRKGVLPTGKTSDEKLWRAKDVVDACVHPQSNEIIPVAFRISAFVPVNIPICAGMLFVPPTLTNTVLFQWGNQTYNAAFNFANRNISGTQSMRDLATSYLLASGISVVSAVGLGGLVDRLQGLNPGARTLLRTTVPYTAVALAGATNVLMMRRNELTTGIDVTDAEGRVLGKSKVAAKKSLMEVALTRVALPAPILLLPPYILSVLRRMDKMPTRPMPRFLTELGVLIGCLWVAFPGAIALFPQQGSIALSQLEPELQQGQKDQVVFYNKGI